MNVNEDLRRDMLVPIILFIVFGIFGIGLPLFFIMTLIPVLCYGLAIYGSSKPKEIYLGKNRKRNAPYRFWNEPKYQNHPVVLPRVFCGLEAILCLILGFSTLILFPISFYLFNWSSIYWAMAEGRVAPMPSIPHGQQRYAKQGPQQTSKQSAEDVLRKMGETTQRFLQSDEVKEATRTFRATVANVAQEVNQGMKNAKSTTSNPTQKQTAYKKPQPSPDEIAQQLKIEVIRQIEANDLKLQDINHSLGGMLETMFGNSKITIAKYQAGVDEAIEMSSQNLQAAREYAKTGSNPKVMQKFLDRSNLINQKTNELIDALVTHQHNLMEEDVNELTNSLEDLQDSLKYYR